MEKYSRIKQNSAMYENSVLKLQMLTEVTF